MKWQHPPTLCDSGWYKRPKTEALGKKNVIAQPFGVKMLNTRQVKLYLQTSLSNQSAGLCLDRWNLSQALPDWLGDDTIRISEKRAIITSEIISVCIISAFSVIMRTAKQT